MTTEEALPLIAAAQRAGNQAELRRLLGQMEDQNLARQWEQEFRQGQFDANEKQRELDNQFRDQSFEANEAYRRWQQGYSEDRARASDEQSYWNTLAGLRGPRDFIRYQHLLAGMTPPTPMAPAASEAAPAAAAPVAAVPQAAAPTPTATRTRTPETQTQTRTPEPEPEPEPEHQYQPQYEQEVPPEATPPPAPPAPVPPTTGVAPPHMTNPMIAPFPVGGPGDPTAPGQPDDPFSGADKPKPKPVGARPAIDDTTGATGIPDMIAAPPPATTPYRPEYEQEVAPPPPTAPYQPQYEQEMAPPTGPVATPPAPVPPKKKPLPEYDPVLGYGMGGTVQGNMAIVGDDPTGMGRENREMIQVDPRGAVHVTPIPAMGMGGYMKPPEMGMGGTLAPRPMMPGLGDLASQRRRMPHFAEGGVLDYSPFISTDRYTPQQIGNIPAFEHLRTGGTPGTPNIDDSLPGSGAQLPFGHNLSLQRFNQLLPSQQEAVRGATETPREMGGLGALWSDSHALAKMYAPRGAYFGPTNLAGGYV